MSTDQAKRPDPPTPKRVTIYTDGGCDPNPGPGGYGVVLLSGRQRKELTGGYHLTTNNRMEILAVIKGLEALKTPSDVTVYSDSQYVVNAVTKGWARKWRAKDWWRTKDEKAKNPDLWARVLELCERHSVTFKWVKGHAGDEENERCDALATEAMQGPLVEDEGYTPEPKKAKKPKQQKLLPRRPPRSTGGPPCRKCAGTLERRVPKRKPPESGKSYYEFFYRCSSCGWMFMPPEAKHTWP